jgi:hypothetical protein
LASTPSSSECHERAPEQVRQFLDKGVTKDVPVRLKTPANRARSSADTARRGVVRDQASPLRGHLVNNLIEPPDAH